MLVKDVRAAIGSLRCEGLHPCTRTVQILYAQCEDYEPDEIKRHKVGKGNIRVVTGDNP